ncbi:hypothetical protein AGOR_G00041040 [Albula goreensis]|uniref:Ig-like domain-containing protein n=1 Tax=Albula goreensis TaxID=1534307 RepID=A0A8T3DYJ0_9TELE|nr:hypothetical protein AGOR_G00041040 [Albula goreensis]
MECFPQLILLWVTLSEAYSLSSVNEVVGPKGGSVSILCIYDLKYRDSVKFWCQGYYRNGCKVLAKTDSSSRTTENTAISDDQTQGIFTVTMRNLMESDMGYYSCGIETENMANTNSVYVRVSKGDLGLSINSDRINPVLQQTPVQSSTYPAPKRKPSEKKEATITSRGKNPSVSETVPTGHTPSNLTWIIILVAGSFFILLLVAVVLFTVTIKRNKRREKNRLGAQHGVENVQRTPEEDCVDDIQYAEVSFKKKAKKRTEQEEDCVDDIQYAEVSFKKKAKKRTETISNMEESVIYSDIRKRPQ